MGGGGRSQTDCHVTRFGGRSGGNWQASCSGSSNHPIYSPASNDCQYLTPLARNASSILTELPHPIGHEERTDFSWVFELLVQLKEKIDWSMIFNLLLVIFRNIEFF